MAWLALPNLVIAAPVNANNYDSFWLWSGVKTQKVLQKAKTVYLLNGQIEAGRNVVLTAQRPATPHVKNAKVWIVYRVATLTWTPKIYEQINAHIKKWRAAGNDVVGIQIDFDAKTARLGEYARFLKGLRTHLPANCKLGVTGLMDWGANANAEDLIMLSGVVDELIIQTYQGRHTIPNYQNYFTNINRIKIPFHIGIIQNGEWEEPIGLSQNPNFKGYVVFLQNGVN